MRYIGDIVSAVFSGTVLQGEGAEYFLYFCENLELSDIFVWTKLF